MYQIQRSTILPNVFVLCIANAMYTVFVVYAIITDMGFGI